MKARIITTMMTLLAVALAVALSYEKKNERVLASETEQKTKAPEEAKQLYIPYETLRQWTVPSGGIGMEILVSEKATKERVLALARHLRSKYLSEGFILIQVFDSKEAYLNRDNPSYPEKKYFKHFLVDLVRNPKTGYDEITWVAEGRDH